MDKYFVLDLIWMNNLTNVSNLYNLPKLNRRNKLDYFGEEGWNGEAINTRKIEHKHEMKKMNSLHIIGTCLHLFSLSLANSPSLDLFSVSFSLCLRQLSSKPKSSSGFYFPQSPQTLHFPL